MAHLTRTDILNCLDAVADWAEMHGLEYKAVRCSVDGWGIEVTKGARTRFIPPLTRNTRETVESHVARMIDAAQREFSARRQVMERRGQFAAHA